MEQLRELHFDDLNAAVAEALSLLRSGYDRIGNWSLGQVSRHLLLVQDPSVDGYPKWMSLFAFLRPVMRRILLPKVLSGNSPRGIRDEQKVKRVVFQHDREVAKESNLRPKQFKIVFIIPILFRWSASMKTGSPQDAAMAVTLAKPTQPT